MLSIGNIHFSEMDYEWAVGTLHYGNISRCAIQEEAGEKIDWNTYSRKKKQKNRLEYIQ
jgi:hypothetical protein